MNSIRCLASIIVLAASSLLADEAPENKIADHLKRDPSGYTPAKHMRLRYVIVRVPMTAMSQALEADVGTDSDFWNARLDAWEKAGTLEILEPGYLGGCFDLEDEREFKLSEPQPYRFIGVGAAATHWYESVEAREHHESSPDQKDLLQDLSEYRIEPPFMAKVSLCPGGKLADLSLKLNYLPKKPEKRPVTTWPIPPFDVARMMFRPWSIEVNGRIRLEDTVLLGTQMEAPHDGQAHTGHVLAAFVRVFPAPGNPLPPPERTKPAPGVRVQTWTLSVPGSMGLPWLQSRKPGADDTSTLHAWLADGKTELLSVAAVMGRAGERSAVESKLEWEDVEGFEPASSHTDYRPRPCDMTTYSLTHSLSVQITAQGEQADAFAPSSPTAPAYWTTETELRRPPAATRWLKWKTAMERDEHDPNAVEVGEAGRADERTHSDVVSKAGQVSMVGSALKGDRLQVTFQRLIEDLATKSDVPAGKALPPPAPLLHTWIIETPLSWQARLLAADSAALTALGTELLASIGKDDVHLVGQLTSTRSIESTEPRLYFGGAFVNTAPGTNGIFFNTRSVDFAPVGDQMKTEITSADNGERSLEYTSIGEPEWRSWGIWQPGIKTTNAANSGIEQPIFPHCELKGRWIIEPGETSVIAALRMSEPGRIKPSAPRLRWYVAHLDAEAQPRTDANFGRGGPTWQALVLRVPTDRVIAEDSTTALRLLHEAETGTTELLDLLTVKSTDALHAAFGSDTYFTNGREEDDILTSNDTLPAGTGWGDQIRFDHRIVGFSLDFDALTSEWKVERDEQAPSLISDSFPFAELEWPEPLDYNAETKIPTTTVNVQRPLFQAHRSTFKSALPKANEALLKRLSQTTVLVIRRR